MKKRRKVIIGGDEYEVMEEGNCFIETKRKRYNWRDGELKRFVAREKPGKPDKDGNRKPELVDWGYDRYTGNDIVEIKGVDFDKGRGNNCWIQMADGSGAVYPAPEVEDVSAIYAAQGGKVGGHIKGARDSKSYGKLTVYGDFETVMFAKDHYNLSDAEKARSVLRYLCGCAVGKSNAKSKADIREHVDTVNSDWRPSQDFRNRLKTLFECVGSHRGFYWIKD